MASTSIDITGLSTGERLRLLEELWDSLAEQANAAPLSEEQRRELDRRNRAMEEDPSAGIPWEEVVRRIQAKTK